MKKREVEFKVGKNTLRGSLFIPDGQGSFPGVVFYHGRYSNRARYLNMAESLAQRGIMSLAFDFRGCGKSDGVQSEQTLEMGIADGKAALEFLLSQNVHKERVGVHGTSFGGYVAGNVLLTFDKIKSIALRAPAAYGKSYSEMLNTPEGYFNQKENWEDSLSYKGIKNFKGNLLILQSENDKLLPKELVSRYYTEGINAKRKEMFIIRGARHDISEPEILSIYYKKVVDWFLETL